MALYLGNEQVKLWLGEVPYCLNLVSSTLILNGVRLLTLDGYILRDLNGRYLTAKEGD